MGSRPPKAPRCAGLHRPSLGYPFNGGLKSLDMHRHQLATTNEIQRLRETSDTTTTIGQVSLRHEHLESLLDLSGQVLGRIFLLTAA